MLGAGGRPQRRADECGGQSCNTWWGFARVGLVPLLVADVGLGEEARLPVIAALHDVQRVAGNGEAGAAGHGRRQTAGAGSAHVIRAPDILSIGRMDEGRVLQL